MSYSEYKAALAELDKLWDQDLKPGSKELLRFQKLTEAIDLFETEAGNWN